MVVQQPPLPAEKLPLCSYKLPEPVFAAPKMRKKKTPKLPHDRRWDDPDHPLAQMSDTDTEEEEEEEEDEYEKRKLRLNPYGWTDSSLVEVEDRVKLQVGIKKRRERLMERRSGLRQAIGVEEEEEEKEEEEEEEEEEGSGNADGDGGDEEVEEQWVEDVTASSKRDQVGESSAARELEERDGAKGAVKEDNREEREEEDGEKSWLKEVMASFLGYGLGENSAPKQAKRMDLTTDSEKGDDEEEEWVNEVLASFAEDEAAKNGATEETEENISSESSVQAAEQIHHTSTPSSRQQAQSHSITTSYDWESSAPHKIEATTSNPNVPENWKYDFTATSVLGARLQSMRPTLSWESRRSSEMYNIPQSEDVPEERRVQGPISFSLEAQLNGMKSLLSSQQSNRWNWKGREGSNEPSPNKWSRSGAVTSCLKAHIDNTIPSSPTKASANESHTIEKNEEDEIATHIPRFHLRHAGPNIASREGKSGAVLDDLIHRDVSIADHLMGHLNSFLIQKLNQNQNIRSNSILHINIANNTVSAPTTASTSSLLTKPIVRNLESNTTATDREEDFKEGSDFPTRSPKSSRWSFPPTEELMPAIEGDSSETTPEKNDISPMTHQVRRAELEDLLSGQKANLHVHMWSNDVRSHSMDALRGGKTGREMSVEEGEIETDTDRVARLKSKIAFWKRDGSPSKEYTLCEDQPKYNGKMPTVPMFVRDVEDVPEEHWGKMEEVWARDTEARLRRDGWNGKSSGRLRRLMNNVGFEARETKFTRTFMKERSWEND